MLSVQWSLRARVCFVTYRVTCPGHLRPGWLSLSSVVDAGCGTASVARPWGSGRLWNTFHPLSRWLGSSQALGQLHSGATLWPLGGASITRQRGQGQGPCGEGTAKADLRAGQRSTPVLADPLGQSRSWPDPHGTLCGRPWNPRELGLTWTSCVGAGGRVNVDACRRNPSRAGPLASPRCPALTAGLASRRPLAVGTPPPPSPGVNRTRG